ncbi:hypothetical protein [Calothrix sp. 336/3]|uniref:hypothetical protein n=1 Tax=Calothrix sp. 336/3 TaxID=1337936 RepID=UPI0011874390|nr:hypothetical protein [Calothrix sp. 336/3]
MMNLSPDDWEWREVTLQVGECQVVENLLLGLVNGIRNDSRLSNRCDSYCPKNIADCSGNYPVRNC